MLVRLRGRQHEVLTGVAARGRRDRVVPVATAVVSRVLMAAYSEATIEEYVASGSPLDKAGAYAIQDLQGALVDAVVGSYTQRRGAAASRRRAGSWPASVCRSASGWSLDLEHVLRTRDLHGLGQGRVRADDRDRLLNLVGRDHAVGQVQRARGREPRREVLGLAHAPGSGAWRRARGPRRYGCAARPLEQRAAQGEEVAVRRAPVGAGEDGGVDGAGSDRLRRRRAGSENRRAAWLGPGRAAGWPSARGRAPRGRRRSRSRSRYPELRGSSRSPARR